MKRQYDPAFLKILRNANVRIRKSFKQRIVVFARDPHHPKLNNHALKNEYKGYRSIDITADYRAIYEEITENNEPVAYFILIGKHKELYNSNLKENN